MKKILVAFNATAYSRTLAAFAITMARQTHSALHGFFFNPTAALLAQYPLSGDLPLASAGLVGTEKIIEESQKLVDADIREFRENCAEKGVGCKAESLASAGIEELVEHSAFSDLILCDSKEQIGGIAIRELLVDTHCPVVLVPQNAEIPSTSVLCYDESFSSMFAMKMYSYIFPEWKALPTTVLSISPKRDNEFMREDDLQSWLPHHFSNLQRQILQGDIQKELTSFIATINEPSVVVMGAYGRNAVSRLFHKSLANTVIDKTNALLFIVHE